MNSIEVRPARLDDVLPACRARAASWRAAYAGRAPQDMRDVLDPDADASRGTPWVARNPDRLFVAALDGDVLGRRCGGHGRWTASVPRRIGRRSDAGLVIADSGVIR